MFVPPHLTTTGDQQKHKQGDTWRLPGPVPIFEKLVTPVPSVKENPLSVIPLWRPRTGGVFSFVGGVGVL